MNLAAERCIVIWSVNSSREHSWFSFYLIKMWWCLKSCRGDRLVEWQGIKTPITWLVSVEDPVWCSRICLAFTMACICQGAERDAPFPHVSREDFTWALLYFVIIVHCWLLRLSITQVPPNPQCWFLSADENGTNPLNQFCAILSSLNFVLGISQLQLWFWCFFFLFFFYWAILLHCHLQCFTDSLGASLVKLKKSRIFFRLRFND